MYVLKTEGSFSGMKLDFLVGNKHNARYDDQFDRKRGPFRRKRLPKITFEYVVQKRNFDILENTQLQL